MGRNFGNNVFQVLIVVLIVLVVKQYPAESKWVLNQVLKRVDTVVSLERFAPLGDKIDDLTAIVKRNKQIPAIDRVASAVAQVVPAPTPAPTPTPFYSGEKVYGLSLPFLTSSDNNYDYDNTNGLIICPGVKISERSSLREVRINVENFEQLATWLGLCNGNKVLLVIGAPVMGPYAAADASYDSYRRVVSIRIGQFNKSQLDLWSELTHEMIHAVQHHNGSYGQLTSQQREAAAYSIGDVIFHIPSCGDNYQCYVSQEYDLMSRRHEGLGNVIQDEHEWRQLKNTLLEIGSPIVRN